MSSGPSSNFPGPREPDGVYLSEVAVCRTFMTESRLGPCINVDMDSLATADFHVYPILDHSVSPE